MIDNKKSLVISLFVLLGLAMQLPISSQTIEEKKARAVMGNEDLTPEMYRYLIDVNTDLRKDQEHLRTLYAQVAELYDNNAPESDYKKILNDINETRDRIFIIENSWREMAVQNGNTDAYALWHQPETTIGQLIMDYGSQDFVYMLSPEIAAIKISVDSNLLIPRASWSDMLNILLSQNGIGYTQLNPFLRQLYLLKDNRSDIKLITNNRRDLEILPPDARVCFVLTPEPADVRRIWLFLEKFINSNSTTLQQIGRDIMIIGPVAEIQDLLTLQDFVANNKGDKEFKVFPVSRVDVEEMAKILGSIFDHTQGEVKTEVFFGPKERGGPPPRPRPSSSSSDNTPINGLKIIPLANVAKAIFLVGTKEEIHKAEQIIRQVESQVGEAREKVIFWYTAKHADPSELAEVLQKIYFLMIKTGVHKEEGEFGRPRPPVQLTPIPTADQIANEIVQRERDLLPVELYQTSYYQQGNYVVNPAPVEPKRTPYPKVTNDRDNFIVTPKTGSIAMVVEADILPKLKELIKKLDVPKRMVQLEALLFERRVRKENNFGLNLLRIGDCASNIASQCVSWSTPSGIFDYMLSRKETCNLPAYDFTYRFLMTQEDIQINASPSVVAVNQTPATIAIVEETSINTGIYNVETAKGVTLERAFTRAQYGITLEMTPMIHITEDGEGPADEPNYITLDTDVTFDTPQGQVATDRPNVTRRHITNQVSVPDGQTIILGGLRRKQTRDYRESIPFVGELPALGKFFSMRQTTDDETEMFIFITPTIIASPLEDFERIKCDEMKRRPGDIPEFLCSLVAAREMEKNQVLAQSMEILLGPEPDRCYTPGYFRPSACGGGRKGYRGKECFGDYYPSCGEYNGR